MPLLEIGKLATVLGFLGVLLGAQYVLRRNRLALRARLAPKGQLQLIETLALSNGERVVLISVNGRECLLHSARNSSAIVLLDRTQEVSPCAAY